MREFSRIEGRSGGGVRGFFLPPPGTSAAPPEPWDGGECRAASMLFSGVQMESSCCVVSSEPPADAGPVKGSPAQVRVVMGRPRGCPSPSRHDPHTPLPHKHTQRSPNPPCGNVGTFIQRTRQSTWRALHLSARLGAGGRAALQKQEPGGPVRPVHPRSAAVECMLQSAACFYKDAESEAGRHRVLPLCSCPKDWTVAGRDFAAGLPSPTRKITSFPSREDLATPPPPRGDARSGRRATGQDWRRHTHNPGLSRICKQTNAGARWFGGC